jgi:lipopolysaccharide export system protein LptC
VSQAQRFDEDQAPSPARMASAPTQPPRLSGRNRYSIFVGWMKILLPALAVALVLMVVIWPQLKLYEGRFRVRVSDISLDQADDLTMLNARYEGDDADNRPFLLTADQAIQSSEDKDLIDLEMPKGDITLEDGTWLVLDAQDGLYNSDSQLLDLRGNVTLFHDKGFELRTESARVDLAGGIAEGDETTEGQGPAGSSLSEGFRVLERGTVLIFTGKSQVILFPADPEDLPDPADPAEADTAKADPTE